MNEGEKNMAGIGFHLKSLYEKETFSSRVKAYGYAGFITAGPWLSMVLSIAVIGWMLQAYHPVPYAEKELFLLSVSYSFIFSLMLHGLVQLVLTRYLADLLYEKRDKEVFAAFLGSSKLVGSAALLIGTVFCLFSPLPLLYKAVLLALFLTVNLIWLLMVFLTAAKFYQAVAYAFVAGTGTGAVLAFLFTRYALFPSTEHGPALNQLAGFTAGMAVTLVFLFQTLVRTFPERGTEGQFAFLAYFDKYPTLAAIGFLYNASIWVCNWVIWYGEGSFTVASTFRFHTANDSAMFWAYLTIIPTLVSFLISVETRFYQSYRQFFGQVNNGGTLEQVEQARDGLYDVLKKELGKLLRNQGLVSLAIIGTAGFLTTLMNVNGVFVSLFRFTVVGAFANAMLLVIMQLMLYFDDRQGALRSIMVFFGCNAGLSLLFLPLGYRGYGLGFALGSTLALIYAAIRFAEYLNEIDYYVYCRPGERERPAGRFHRLGGWLDKKAAPENRWSATDQPKGYAG
ncbi:exopolysaccharide Pel transporter PelG [Paenibacillus aurantius]|uniref:Exopolysaccharide Pel transporter PelG n=1 Tax=Paenibacillus aurantius TaxID=2918900 RepID=A0AA96LD05_9BACL|nr:exopolysaccharide Pel transporter PelG [Paenibacillus aurantius]WNQ10943.1 exopolysaccharide Pel transporter PelG [Paenibacillus aurantius]